MDLIYFYLIYSSDKLTNWRDRAQAEFVITLTRFAFKRTQCSKGHQGPPVSFKIPSRLEIETGWPIRNRYRAFHFLSKWRRDETIPVIQIMRRGKAHFGGIKPPVWRQHAPSHAEKLTTSNKHGPATLVVKANKLGSRPPAFLSPMSFFDVHFHFLPRVDQKRKTQSEQRLILINKNKN